MPLDEIGRARTAAQWMRENRAPCAFTKDQLRLAVDAIDGWVDDNQASFNQALPVGFRATASLDQKVDLFMYVLMRRRGRLRAEEDQVG